MEGMPFNDVKALEALLRPLGSSEEDRALCPKRKAAVTPANIGSNALKKREKKEPKEADPDFELGDRYGRLQPEHDIVYKQDVSANDAYFHLSGKNPSSLCCDIMVMRIKLPQTESVSDIQLDLKATYIKLSSALYFLALYLPHKIKHEESKAKWEVDTETLIITMPLEREPFL